MAELTFAGLQQLLGASMLERSEHLPAPQRDALRVVLGVALHAVSFDFNQHGAVPGAAFIDPTASVHPGARIGQGSLIGPHAVIGPDVTIGAGSYVERMRVTASGDVGVGTTSPASRLDIDAGALTMKEMTAPSAPAANSCVIYAEDNGSGKTRLMVRFASGAAQQIAIEP